MQPALRSWRLLPLDLAVDRFAAKAQLSPALASVLWNRSVTDPDQVARFLNSPLTDLHPPERLPGAIEAADRIWLAIQNRRSICVYGDYDADGVTGTTILLQVLTCLGANVDYYVPNRLEEGYGLNTTALQQLAGAGTQVVVTVDCGIASLREAQRARELGIELIITDHHEFKDELPDAACRVHPRLPGGDYPFAGLSGAGVAFKLAWLVAMKASGGDKVTAPLRECLLDAVALAALGLVADVMPLLDENRVIVKHGLKRLRDRPSTGLAALLTAAGLADTKEYRAEHIAFKLAPRLNSAGRLGCARMVVDLLTTPSAARARDLANFLEGQNSKRQSMERGIIAQAREMLEAGACAGEPAIVLAHHEWHPGVIGIVAGRLAEQYGKPTLLIATTPNTATGSGRSVPGLALHEALATCDEILLAHGGHAAAAGFRLDPSRIDEFRGQFMRAALDVFPQGPPTPCLILDAELPLAALTLKLVKELDRLEPYGVSNPRPRFLAAGLQVVGEPKKIGGGERHLSFRVRQGQTTLRAVGWGMAERSEELISQSRQCCLAFVPKINEWNNQVNVELEVADFQPGPVAQLA